MIVTAQKKFEIDNRRAKVARLYLAKYTMRQIAATLKISLNTVSLDVKAIKKKWLESALVDTNERISIEQASIDDTEAEARRQWVKGNIDAKWLEIILRACEQRRKLFGLGGDNANALSQLDIPPIEVIVRAKGD